MLASLTKTIVTMITDRRPQLSNKFSNCTRLLVHVCSALIVLHRRHPEQSSGMNKRMSMLEFHFVFSSLIGIGRDFALNLLCSSELEGLYMGVIVQRLMMEQEGITTFRAFM
jgi:hypothetical protein